MKWQKHAFAAGDFALSVLLTAVAIWLIMGVLKVAIAFALWQPYEAPGWLAFRIALVVSLYIQARRAHRERKAQ